MLRVVRLVAFVFCVHYHWWSLGFEGFVGSLTSAGVGDGPSGLCLQLCLQSLGWTSARPAAMPRKRNTARATQSTAHRASTTVNKSPGHRTRNTTHSAGAPVNSSHVDQDTAHAKQHTEWAHW